MSKNIVVIGGSTGIGKAIVEKAAQNAENNIFAFSRQKELMSKNFKSLNNVSVHHLDLEHFSGPKFVTDIEKLGPIDILINNAGNAHGLDNIQEGNLEDWDAMIDINVKGLLYVSKAVLPTMLLSQSGHIINIGSTAGKEVYPKGNVYCASKYAVDAINQGMRIDLNGKGIKVGAINPGMVATEFSEVRFKGDTQKATKIYQGFTPLQAKDIAEIIWFTVTRPAHVNIADLTVMALDQASSTIVNKK